jgi:hypothetical protein
MLTGLLACQTGRCAAKQGDAQNWSKVLYKFEQLEADLTN